MRLHRTTTALAALLMVGSLGACADYTTTGVPSGEKAANEEVEDGAGASARGHLVGADRVQPELAGPRQPGHHRRLLQGPDVRPGPRQQLLRRLHDRGREDQRSARSGRP